MFCHETLRNACSVSCPPQWLTVITEVSICYCTCLLFSCWCTIVTYCDHWVTYTLIAYGIDNIQKLWLLSKEGGTLLQPSHLGCGASSANQPSPGQYWTVLASSPRAPATPSKVPNWLALSSTVPVVLSTVAILPLLPVLETFWVLNSFNVNVNHFISIQ